MRPGAALAAAAAIALSGCGGWSDVYPDDPNDPPPSPTEVSLTDVARDTGTPLPTSATDVTALRIDDNPLTYRVTFDAPSETTLSWCLAHDNSGKAPYVGLTEADETLWGITSAPEDSQTCSMSSPDGIWQIDMLISAKASDPVRVGMVQVH